MRCKDCAHLTGRNTCDFPTPAWVVPRSPVLDPRLWRECSTFSQKMVVVHTTPPIDEKCEHVIQ